ncbi:MAG: peptidase, partial [Rhodothermales bacterium]|nr:peptidase [Rhodothermales bacterium]
PCVSPWGYETINRWNPGAIDPNRSFRNDGLCEEAAALMAFVRAQSVEFLAHIDLHETTDTDNSEFRPALSARDAVEHEIWHIPDGFYLVVDKEKPTPEFHAAIINSVEQETHIAPADADGKIIGAIVEQNGVISYAVKDLGLCMGMTDAKYVGTTEVYPDSPKSDAENCIAAQVASVTGALDYLIGVDGSSS